MLAILSGELPVSGSPVDILVASRIWKTLEQFLGSRDIFLVGDGDSHGAGKAPCVELFVDVYVFPPKSSSRVYILDYQRELNMIRIVPDRQHGI